MVLKHYHFKKKLYSFCLRSEGLGVNLKDFKSSNLLITKNECVDRHIYHIDYSKNDNTKPLYLKMLDFHGYVEIVNDTRILKIVKINLNDNFLIYYKKVLNNIINNINEFYDSKYVLNDGYLKIIIDTVKCEDDTDDNLIIPMECLLKFDMVVVSCRLATEKNDTLNIEFYLQECFFDNDWFKY